MSLLALSNRFAVPLLCGSLLLVGGGCDLFDGGGGHHHGGGGGGHHGETDAGGESCGAYTDVVYRVTVSHEIKGTTFQVSNQFFPGLGANDATPVWGANGGSGSRSPFDRAAFGAPTNGSVSAGPTFANGFVRLRYTNDANGNPIAGTVSLVEAYIPTEFHQTNGAVVDWDVDHSLGIIDNTLANCGGGATTTPGDAACVDHQPALHRTCASNAQGTLAGTTLTWGACTPAQSGFNNWSFVSARAAAGVGCATGWNSFGNVRSDWTLVPTGNQGDSYQTWNQGLNPFVFKSGPIGTATFTMAPMQIPTATNWSNQWIAITSSTVIGTDCGSEPGTTLLCNIQ